MRACSSLLISVMMLGGVSLASGTTCTEQKKVKTKQVCGYVIGRNGERVPGAEVSVVDAGGSKRTTHTDSEGSFQLGELKRGKYDLLASYSGEVNARAPIELTASKSDGRCTKPLVIRLRFAGGCSGVSVDKGGGRRAND